ncbi:MAG TPA: transglycosylase SLT domain-containing protein [Gemmatimonadales bacterium]|nr:transglycosylase SLT domain-containing protein [Gemmatimonadales bacterium]
MRRRQSLEPVVVVMLATVLSSCASGGGTPPPAPVPAPVSEAVADADATPVPAAGSEASRSPKAVAPRPSAKAANAAKAGKAANAAKAANRVATRRAPPRPKAVVDSAALERQVTARYAYYPLAQVLARRTRRPDVADRTAMAVVREANRLRMSPSLLAAVVLVENRPLDSAAVSSQGAVGLMQVMPMHAGSYGCASSNLREIDANVCHGASLLHLFVVRTRSVTTALRRYNGCVRGTNTPRCHRYAPRVLRLASALRRDMLETARNEFMVASVGASATAAR